MYFYHVLVIDHTRHRFVQDDCYEVVKKDRSAENKKDQAETDQENVKNEDPMYLKVM